MTRITRRITTIILALVLIGSVAACGEVKVSSQKADAKLTEQGQRKKQSVVGFPKIEKFAEAANLKRYYEEVDDPKRTGYIYLLNFGKVYAEYTVEGKVSSLNSSFTAPEQYKDCGQACGITVPLAEPDGSYGEYPDGIFFWTTDGVLIEWSGDYQYSTERLELREPPQISLVKNVK